MSVPQVNTQNTGAAGKAAAALPSNTSVEKFEQYLKKHGLNAAAKKFLKSKAGKLSEGAYFKAALEYASQKSPQDVITIFNIIEDGGSPQFLTSVLFKVKNHDLIQQAFEHFKDRANYKQILSQNYGAFNSDKVSDYYEAAGAEDTNNNGTIEQDEPGYEILVQSNPNIDSNKNGVIDLSEICVHLFDGEKTKNAHAFSQTIKPLRTSVHNAMISSYEVGNQGEQYEKALGLILKGNYPADVKMAAQWMLTDYQAHQAVSSGDFQGALAIYDKFSEEAGIEIEPTGLYADLKATNESGHLDFLETYYAFYKDNFEMPGGGTINGVTFLRSSLHQGFTFHLSFNDTANKFIKEAELTEGQRALFFKVSDKKFSFNVLSSTQISGNSVFRAEFSQPPELHLKGEILSNADTKLTYNLATKKFEIAIPGANLLARDPNSTDLDLIAKGQYKDFKIATLESPQVTQNAATPTATVRHVRDRMIESLASGEGITGYVAIAPDKDANVHASPKKLQSLVGLLLDAKYVKYAKFVFDPNTERGQTILKELKASRNDPQALKEYIDANLTEQERLCLYRLGDNFVGGSMGPYQNLAKAGYQITDIEYTQNGDPCIIRITAAKSIPVDQLRGDMKAGFETLSPELQEKYRANGIPVQITIEVFSTTGDAVVGTGNHLGPKDVHAVGLVTHAPHSMMDNLLNTEAGNYTTKEGQQPMAYIPVHCHATMFDSQLRAQWGSDLWIAPRTGDETPGIAHASVFFKAFASIITGTNVHKASQKAYESVGGPNPKAYVDKEVAGTSRFIDSNNDGTPNVFGLEDGEVTITYNPITGEYYLLRGKDEPIVVDPNNYLYGIIAKKDNLETQYAPEPAAQPKPSAPAQETGTVVASADSPPSTPSISVSL
jgi:hypothetical protein